MSKAYWPLVLLSKHDHSMVEGAAPGASLDGRESRALQTSTWGPQCLVLYPSPLQGCAQHLPTGLGRGP